VELRHTGMIAPPRGDRGGVVSRASRRKEGPPGPSRQDTDRRLRPRPGTVSGARSVCPGSHVPLPARAGPTYAHLADIRLLAAASCVAAGNSIVATEAPSLPLHGWAMAVSAVNLVTNDVTANVRTADQIDLLEHLVDQVYNGWSHKEVGRRACAVVIA
jgi:hypothetical protein